MVVCDDMPRTCVDRSTDLHVRPNNCVHRQQLDCTTSRCAALHDNGAEPNKKCWSTNSSPARLSSTAERTMAEADLIYSPLALAVHRAPANDRRRARAAEAPPR